MAKKYLSSEEASAALGVSIDELNQLRESGELRGFADRGTFKFKQEDIEEYARSRQADSDPEVPLNTDESDDSVLSPDEDALSEQPTVIRKEDTDAPLQPDESGSDSDVRLVLPDSLTEDEGESVGDSDSDVRLVGEDSAAPLTDSGSDSDVKLISDEEADETGSHIKLAEDSRTDSSLLKQSEEETGLGLGGEGEGGVGEEDDAVSLEDDGGESVLLEEDSGIALDAGSDIGLAADSGIALEAPADSGISLELDEDSGISLAADDDLEVAADSGISLDDSTDQTVPVTHAEPSGGEQTEFEAQLADDESDFELGAVEEGSDADTSVILFDDEDEDEAAAVATDDFDVEEDDFGADFGDDFEEAGVVLDDEVELDVFDAEEEDFDAFQTGQSHAEFAAPMGMAAPRGAIEANWGAGTFIGLLSSSVVLLLCLAVMFDLIRSMWGWREPTPIAQPVIDAIAGLIS